MIFKIFKKETRVALRSVSLNLDLRVITLQQMVRFVSAIILRGRGQMLTQCVLISLIVSTQNVARDMDRRVSLGQTVRHVSIV